MHMLDRAHSDQWDEMVRFGATAEAGEVFTTDIEDEDIDAMAYDEMRRLLKIRDLRIGNDGETIEWGWASNGDSIQDDESCTGAQPDRAEE